MKRISCLTLIFIAHSSTYSVDFPIAPETYKLEYSVEKSSTSSPAEKVKGTYRIIESNGSIRFSYVNEKNSGFEYLSQGKYCFLSKGDRSQALAFLGTKLSYLELPLYMPFTFHSLEIYRDWDIPRSEMKSFVERNVPNPNFKILQSTLAGKERFAAGTIVDNESSGEDQKVVLLGPPWAPLIRFDYSRFRDFDGIKIPSFIKATTYSQIADGNKGAISKPKDVYEFSLKAYDKTLGKNDDVTLSSVVKKGGLISFSADDGKGAGLLFDPSEPNFEKSLSEALAISARHPERFEKAITKSDSQAFVPILLAVVFGSASLFLLLRPKKSPTRTISDKS